MAALRIVGRATIGEKEFAATASTLVPLRTGFSALPYPPTALDGVVGLGVGPVFPDFFKLAAGPILFPQLVGTTTITVTAEKLNGFNDVVNLAIEGLPAGLTAEVQPIAAGQPTVAFNLTGPADLPEGEHLVKLTGTAVFNNQPRTVVLEGVPLRVIKPLVVAVAPAGPIARGATQKVKVTVTRFGDDKGPVTLEFRNLPTGVTAPAGAAVPEGANEVDLDLTAAADAAVGPIANLVVTGTTQVKGAAVTVDSPPAAFEVQ
jgi:hypothetical protein